MGRIVYRSDNPNGFVTGKEYSIDAPCVTVMAAGMGGDSLGHWHFADRGGVDVAPKIKSGKPPYRVPPMEEIAAVKSNGLTVVSTFAGCGGSSLGYRMAGYKVLLANEFVPVAQESYRANMAAGTILDGRDVKEITAESVLKKIGLKRGDLDLFDGSPPCQAFSTAGKREKGWGTERMYEHGAAQKNEDLFFEFVRLRDGLMPRAFVAENVSGLVKGVAKGYFLDILKELKRGYRVEARLLDAQWLGVPQQRQRIIFVGVREDLELGPAWPSPLPYRYSVREAIPWIGDARAIHDTSGQFSVGDVTDRPAPTPTAHGPGHLKVLEVAGGKAVRLRVTQADRYDSTIDVTDRPSLTIRASETSAPVVEVETDISQFAIGAEYDKLNPGDQSEKYFSLVKTDASAPAPMMTASGGKNQSIACAVHPTEKRKFSIAELKRICAFPDDFVLVGTYAQQWERLGNSVPPLMMRAIAEAVRDGVLLPARASARSAALPVRSSRRSTIGSPPKGAGKRRYRGATGRRARTGAAETNQA